MKIVNIHEAKTNLSKLLEEMQQGKQVVIAKAGKPMAELTPYLSEQNNKLKKAFGSMKNQFKYDDKTLVGIDPEIQELFYGKDWNK